MSNMDGNFEIYVMNSDGTGVVRLTEHPGFDAGARWSPDGRRIAWYSNRGGAHQIFVMNADGSGMKALTSDGSNELPSWSPDGRRIAFASTRAMDMTGTAPNTEIYVMNADGSGQMNISRSPTGGNGNSRPAWSRTGAIYFTSNRAGRFQIYAMEDDGSNQRRLTAVDAAGHEFPHAK